MTRGACAAAAMSAALVAALAAAPPVRDTDWGWHVAQGERILAERALPWDDAWMWTTQGVRATPYAWGFDVLLALADRAGGPAGVAALGVASAVALALALHAVMVRRGARPWPAAAVVSAVLLAVRFRLLPRPHMVGDLCLLLAIGLLLDGRDPARRRRWLLLPPLVALWANLHPSAVIGCAALGALWAGEALRTRLGLGEAPLPPRDLARLAAILVACVAATLLTPIGLAPYAFLAENARWTAAGAVTELAPLRYASEPWRLIVLTALLLALPALLGALRRGVRDPGPWLVAALFGVAAAGASRFAVEWLLCTALAAAPAYGAAGRRVRAAAAAAVGLCLARLLVAAGPELLARDRPLLHPAFHCPRAADFLASTPVPQPLYNSHRLGGYLVYRLRGRPKLFWDGRLHFYDFLGQRSFEALHARFGFKTLVLAERDPAHPAEFAEGEAEWSLVHFDDEARVYVDARDPAWEGLRAARGLKRARFRWEVTGPGTFDRALVPDERDPAAAAAELEARAAADPSGYYVHSALARARLLAGDRAGARAAAAIAHATRPTELTRALLRDLP